MQQSFNVGNMNNSVNRGMHQSTPPAGGSYYRPSDSSLVSRSNEIKIEIQNQDDTDS